jgi:hypothetical protein
MEKPPAEAALELTGRVAFVWIALDDPGTISDVADRLHDAEVAPFAGGGVASEDLQELASDLSLLLGAGLLEVVERPEETGR